MAMRSTGCLLESGPFGEFATHSVATGTGLGINAAFLEEIKEENVRLKQILRAIARYLEEDGSTRGAAAELVSLTVSLRDQLGVHFDLEEAYGYFDHVVEAAPELSGLAESARADHRLLRREIHNVVEHAREFLYGGPIEPAHDQLVPRLKRFCRRLEQHESRENELILRAYADDVGVGD